MSTIRPAGSGRDSTAVAFMRRFAAPRAGLVFVSSVPPPSDWPTNDGVPEGNLGHALGWSCEVRRNDVLLINPLGEGIVKAPLPDLDHEWLENARRDTSSAVYLVPASADEGLAELSIIAAGRAGALRAATVRTAIADDHGRTEPVGRNAPCPCGSGKKYKHCHG